MNKITLLLLIGLLSFSAKTQTLDNTFGTNGFVINNLTSGVDWIYAMALQSDGKILVSGTAGGRFTIARYNPDGTFDASFGNNGVVQTNYVFGESWTSIYIIVQPDHKILVSGSNSFKPFVARYNADGTSDVSFGDNGMRQIIVLGQEAPSLLGMVLSEDGKILVSGVKPGNASDPSALYFLRLNSDGSTDISFGPDATGLSLLSRDINYANDTALNSTVHGIAFNSQGNLFVQIEFQINTGTGYLSDYGMIKFSSSGIWDEEFGEGGVAPAHVNHTGQILTHGFKILEDDKIISIARKNLHPQPKRGVLLAKYNADGILDTDFGTNGLVETLLTNPSAVDIEILANDQILITGDDLNTFTSILYHSDGQIDNTYGDNGFFVSKFDPGSYDYGRIAVQQPDGKIIIGGTTSHMCANRGFAMIRFNIAGVTATVPNISEADVKLFPNPTNGRIFIDLHEEFSDVSVKIVNAFGQEIRKYHFGTASQVELDIDLAEGIYFVQVFEKETAKSNFKVVKK